MCCVCSLTCKEWASSRAGLHGKPRDFPLLCLGAASFQTVLSGGLQGVEQFWCTVDATQKGRAGEEVYCSLNILSRKQSSYRMLWKLYNNLLVLTWCASGVNFMWLLKTLDGLYADNRGIEGRSTWNKVMEKQGVPDGHHFEHGNEPPRAREGRCPSGFSVSLNPPSPHRALPPSSTFQVKSRTLSHSSEAKTNFL